MERKQVYELVNAAANEALGRTDVLNENLLNVVDVGDEIFNANAVDNYVRSLVNHIGKVIFVTRAYEGSAPSVLMDGWEFGSVLEKVQMDMPNATENETWELNDNTSYDPNIFYKPKVSAKFFNKRVTFEVPISITEKQVKESFSSPEQLNSFTSMIYNGVDKAMTVKMDSLIMRTINNMIGETFYDAYGSNGSDAGQDSHVRAVNLLYLYKQRYSENDTLTPAQAITTPEFIRFASMTMKNYIKRMRKISTLFNVGGKERFTPTEMLHTIMLADFESAAETYLYDGNGQFRVDNITLPRAETVPYWQGSGEGYEFSDISKINITTSGGHAITLGGILGVMFDRDALGVCNIDRRVTSNYNPKAEFWSQWHKFDAGYFNDLNENFVVFFVA